MSLCMCLIIFFKLLLDPVFPVIAMQSFDFKNSFIAIQLFRVMILNLYLTSEWFLSKSDFVVAMLQKGHWMPIFHKVVGFFWVLSLIQKTVWSKMICTARHKLI